MIESNWVEKSAEEELLQAFRRAIDYFPQDKRIAIWGASVRGTILGCMLEKNGIFDFDYIDNDISKRGQYILNHKILGIEDIEAWKRDCHFIVIPIEYGLDIVYQLKQMGYTEFADFIFIKPDTEKNFVAELTKKKDADTLLFGDSQLVITTIEDVNAECLQTALKKCFDCNKTSFLAIGCLSLGHIYEFIRLNKTYFAKGIKKIYIFLTYEMLAPWHYFLSRTQHSELLHRILDSLRIVDEEYEDYVRIADTRASNYLIEKKYCPVRTSTKGEMDGKKIRKDYASLVYGRKIVTYDVPIIYLHRLLCYCKDNGIVCSIINYPINLDELFRIDSELNALVENNNRIIKNVVESYGGKWIDLSDLLAEEDFVIGASIGSGVYKTGKEKILSKIKEIL